MTLEGLRDYCLALPGVTESTPFDSITLVYKVGNKMFCLANMEGFESFNVKCDPEKAIELRERYSEVLPGYHMSKIHWNTVMVTGSLNDSEMFSWIKDSYDLIVGSLTKKQKEELANR